MVSRDVVNDDIHVRSVYWWRKRLREVSKQSMEFSERQKPNYLDLSVQNFATQGVKHSGLRIAEVADSIGTHLT